MISNWENIQIKWKVGLICILQVVFSEKGNHIFLKSPKEAFALCILLNHLQIFMFTSLLYNFLYKFHDLCKVTYYSTLLTTSSEYLTINLYRAIWKENEHRVF